MMDRYSVTRLSRRRLLLGATAAALSSLAAACGGGGGATDTPKSATSAPAATAAPPTATTSPASAAPTTVAAVTPTISPATATTAPTVSATTAATASPNATALTGSAPAATTAASSAPSSTIAPVEPGDLLKDPQGHFTFTGPKGWVASPDPISPTVAQLSAQNPTRGMRVLESSPTEGKSLQQYAKDSLATLKTNGSFRAGTREQQPTTLGGEPAVLDDYTTPGNGVLGYVVRVLCIRTGLLYSVFFSTEPQAADALQPVVKLVLDTWKFL